MATLPAAERKSLLAAAERRLVYSKPSSEAHGEAGDDLDARARLCAAQNSRVPIGWNHRQDRIFTALLLGLFERFLGRFPLPQKFIAVLANCKPGIRLRITKEHKGASRDGRIARWRNDWSRRAARGGQETTETFRQFRKAAKASTSCTMGQRPFTLGKGTCESGFEERNAEDGEVSCGTTSVGTSFLTLSSGMMLRRFSFERAHGT